MCLFLKFNIAWNKLLQTLYFFTKVITNFTYRRIGESFSLFLNKLFSIGIEFFREKNSFYHGAEEMQILIALIVVGVLLWLVNSFIPMAGSIKSILNAVVIIVVVVWLLNVFGLMHYVTNMHIKRMG